ncbi:MAG: 16S rRNA (adenine(1518)-N(6)/adenine(1519)-N(6))-dimethyltransferase RsmA [Dehalococcoidia bacterium]
MTGSRGGSRSTSSRNRARHGRPRSAPRPKKRFGQHFLSDLNLLAGIADAAEIAPGESAIEVGPGFGGLTAALAERASRVVAVEVDRDLCRVLRERFAATRNVTIVEGDALALTPGELLTRGGAAPPYAVVANLPYNIAAPVLRKFLEGEVRPRVLVVMVQLEVAEAIVAEPGAMSLLSVATQVYGEARMVMKVPPGAFHPPPKVQSAVVRIDVAPEPRVNAPLDVFFRVVRAGFGNPRKQLRNSLSFGLHVKQERIGEALSDASIDATRRPQTLSLAEWAAITRAWVARTRA